MMMDAVSEPDSLEVGLQGQEVRRLPISFIGCIDRFQCPAYRQVITTILIEQDVAPHQCGFRQVIKQLFLLEGEGFESRDLVSQDLQVGETVDHVIESIIIRDR